MERYFIIGADIATKFDSVKAFKLSGGKFTIYVKNLSDPISLIDAMLIFAAGLSRFNKNVSDYRIDDRVVGPWGIVSYRISDITRTDISPKTIIIARDIEENEEEEKN